MCRRHAGDGISTHQGASLSVGPLKGGLMHLQALRAEDVPYVVAPYEADAQLAYLERLGIVDGIITEDSDLLVFGCKNVYFKLNDVEGTVAAISRDDLGKVTHCSLRGWTDAQFRAMAILSGCDYLPSIPGVGLKTAWTLLRKYRTPENVIRALRLEGKKTVPQGYLEAFMVAVKVFEYQRVYDPLEEKLVNLTQVLPGESLSPAHEAFIGE
jgi:exonuclease 1